MTLHLLLLAVLGGGRAETAAVARLVVAAEAGKVATVEAWRTGGTWTLRIRDPAGAEADALPFRDVPVTTVSWVARLDGAHVVECEPAAATVARCELAVAGRPAGSSNPSARLPLEAGLRRGHALLREWTPSARRQAQVEFEAVLAGGRQLALADLEIDALVGLAAARQAEGAAEQSLAGLEAAATRADECASERRFVLAAARWASARASLGLAGAREPPTERATALATARDFRLGVAQLQLARAEGLYARSDFMAALDRYEAALQMFAELGNDEGMIEAHLGLGYAHADLSRDSLARADFERAREMARSVADERSEALATRLLGNLLARAGEEVDAIRLLETARALFEQAEDRVALVALYNALGDLHGRLNDLTTALRYHERAAALARAAGMRGDEGLAGIQVARYQQRLGLPREATASYERARTTLEAAGDSVMAAHALAGLGSLAAADGRLSAAAGQIESALRVVRAGGEARLSSAMLSDLAEVYLAQRRMASASDAASEALRLAGEAKDPWREGRALHVLARIARERGALDDAVALAERAVAVGEGVRARVPGYELRALFFEQLESRYHFYVDLLMELERRQPQQPFERAALVAAERGRARVLLDRFEGADQGGGPRAAPDERERELRAEVRTRALSSQLGTDPRPAEGSAALEESMAALRRSGGARTLPPPRSGRFDLAQLAELQARLSGRGTLLVEISLGAERSYLWAISPERVAVHPLPARAQIESRAREAYALLTGRQREAGELPRERRERTEREDARFHVVGAELSRLLLAPIDGLDGYQRLVIVADGLLSYLPFSALPHPGSLGEGAEYRPLVASHEIVSVPSLAAMLALDARAASRAGTPVARGEGSPLRVAVLADPVYTADDPRLSEVARAERPIEGPAEGGGSVARGARQGVASFPRLLGSRLEALAVGRAAVGADVTVETGLGVDRATAEAALGGSYDVVHLAMHGVADDVHPALSGVVTSLVDARRRPVDGFLRAQDIYEARVSAALVVLSACETALGKLLGGEGITGLVHAFLHAGASSIVATKWRVDDAATEALMTELYRGLFERGASVSGALRAAQLVLLKQRATHAPFYWAAFEVHGVSAPLAAAAP